MPETDLATVAHLLRRAGFGAGRTEVETYAAKPYEEIVEDLLPTLFVLVSHQFFPIRFLIFR